MNIHDTYFLIKYPINTSYGKTYGAKKLEYDCLLKLIYDGVWRVKYAFGTYTIYVDRFELPVGSTITWIWPGDKKQKYEYSELGRLAVEIETIRLENTLEAL